QPSWTAGRRLLTFQDTASVGLDSSAIGACRCRRGDRIATKLLQCMSPLLAQSGHPDDDSECPLLGVKRTSRRCASMSAFDPKRTWRLQAYERHKTQSKM